MLDFDELDELEAALEQAKVGEANGNGHANGHDADSHLVGSQYFFDGYSPPKTFTARPPAPQPGAFVVAKLTTEGVVYRPREDFDEFQAQQLPGDLTGVKLMHTIPLLRAAGPAWLTEAFHAAGSLPKDNSVVAIQELSSFEGGGAGLKAILTVEYAKPDPALHDELFVKLPHEEDQNHKYLIDAILDQNKPEINFATMLAHRMPFRVPKTYFADHCAKTTNFVLITERVPFECVREGDSFERAHDKYLDHQLPRPAYQYYFVLMKQIGRMVGAYKTGRLGEGLEKHFPTEPAVFPGIPIAMTKGKVSSMMAFATKAAANLLPADVKEHPTFLTKDVEHQLVHTTLYIQEMITRSTSNPDYVAFCHPNLNVDNAWWWHNSESKQLDCGVLDWGGYKGKAVAIHLQMALFAGECGLIDAHGDGLLKMFIDEYHGAGGPKLDLEELKLQMTFALIGSAIGTTGTVGTIYRHTPRKEWDSITDRTDRRVEGRFLVRCYALGIIDLLTRWKRHGIYDIFLKWVQAEGLPMRTVE